MPNWVETGNAPDQQGGRWRYYRYDGNHGGFIGNRQAGATISYNKTIHFDRNNIEIANDRHVSAHAAYADKLTGQQANFTVRFYHTTQNFVNVGVPGNANAAVIDYIRNALTHLSNAA